MQELFYEESSRCVRDKKHMTKYYVSKTISIVSLVISIVWLFFSFNFAPIDETYWYISILVNFLPVIGFLLLFFFFLRLKNNAIIDYDYTVVSDSVRIAKVKRDIKRVPILQFLTTDIEVMGKVDSDTYIQYEGMANIKKYIFTSNIETEGEKEFFYIVANANSEKCLMIFECTEKLLINILKTSKRSIIERDYGKEKKGQ